MEQNKNKTISRLKIVTTIACTISGLLAGGNIYRYVIEVPAWRHMNIIYWGEYSRNADLKNGIFLFPFEAILSLVMFVFASIIIIKSNGKLQSVALAIHGATFFSLIGLGLTVVAAPYMLSVRTMGNNAELLQQTFNQFHFWGLLRAIAQVLSFFACVVGTGKVFELKN